MCISCIAGDNTLGAMSSCWFAAGLSREGMDGTVGVLILVVVIVNLSISVRRSTLESSSGNNYISGSKGLQTAEQSFMEGTGLWIYAQIFGWGGHRFFLLLRLPSLFLPHCVLCAVGGG